MSRVSRLLRPFLCSLSLVIAGVAGMAGCESRKERVIDIETPGTDIEVDRDKKDGSLEIDVDNK
jgi:hypothetical protein